MAGAGGEAPCERVESSSAAWIFLYPDKALKLKRPVDFGFLDFTSLDKRRWALDRELVFNREAAPHLYRRVHALTRDNGGFSLDGAGPAVEWALEMKRFADGAVIAEDPRRLDPELAEALGREVARVHARAERVAPNDGRDGLDYVLGSNAGLLRGLAESGVLDREPVERLIAATQAEFDAVEALMLERGRQGMVRRCHADLHLGNILLDQGKPTLFDCIEFNDRLSRIDVLYDLGFLLMDLCFRGLPDEASRALNGWLDEAAREPGEGPWAGLRLLPLFQSLRAAVRAHVEGHQGRPEASRRYIEAALTHLQPAPPAMLAIGGLSGSGKSTLARARAPQMGGSPGAVVLRSDEIRKRLTGVKPTDRLPPEAYGPERSKAVYEAMLAAAGVCLRAGRAVVVDAAFLEPHWREAAEAVAHEAGAPFEGVWLEAPPEVLKARVEARVGDASDADVRVVEAQLGKDIGPMAWARRSLDGALKV